jgi:tRNA A37 threonylcarbamoyladenosine synthetase subunit TsaC/SUA5/YrdC
VRTVADPGVYWAEGEVAAAVDTVRAGGLLLAKGDIGYGLFGTSEDAIRRMYALKGRPFSNPCIFIGDLAVLDEVAEVPNPTVRGWIGELASWTTCAVVLPERPGSRLVAAMDPWARSQSITNGTLAVFLRCGGYLAQVVSRLRHDGIALVGSSANRSSAGNLFRPEELPPEFLAGADLFVEHGDAALANDERKATTIVNLANWSVKRMGVNGDEILASFEKLKADVGPGA